MTSSPLSRWRHARRNPRHSAPLIALTAGLGVFAFIAGGVAYAYTDLQNNITALDVDDLVNSANTATVAEPTASATPTFNDPKAGQPLNILVLGTDDRSGENAAIGGEEGGMRADTTLLFHISADRTRVEAVSIPRDLMVPIPACPQPDGTTYWAQDDAMFNSAFSLGSQQSEAGSDEANQFGVACTILTVQAMTGLTVDEFALVDFAGFEQMVDAIGGVHVCLATDLADSYTGLNLSAGDHDLTGTEALQLARARHIEGTDGSDISRIDRQQQLLKVMLQEVMSQNILSNAGQLYGFLGAATSSLTTSPNLAQLSTLAGLAMSLKGISIDQIEFVTIPFVYDGARVRATAEADALWAALVADQPISGETAAPEAAASAQTEAAGTTSSTAAATPAAAATSAAADPAAATTAATQPPEQDAATETAAEVPLISANCGA